jgi:hypothetical protein
VNVLFVVFSREATENQILQAELEDKNAIIADLKRRIEDLSKAAAEARELRDEVDLLREKSAKVDQLEDRLKKSMKKAEAVPDLKKQLKVFIFFVLFPHKTNAMNSQILSIFSLSLSLFLSLLEPGRANGSVPQKQTGKRRSVENCSSSEIPTRTLQRKSCYFDYDVGDFHLWR